MDRTPSALHWIRSTFPTPNWSLLKTYGTSRILRSSYYWILIVPMAARALRNVRGPYHASVFNSQFTFELVLPFSWQMFYWSAVSVGIATLIYSVRCPELVQRYASFADFSEPGRGQRELFDLLRPLLGGSRVWRSNNWSMSPQNWLRRLLILGFRGDRQRADKEMAVVKREGQLSERVLDHVRIIPAEDVLVRAFWSARGVAEWSYFWSRTLCASLYVLGFLLFLVVLLQNGVYVGSWGIEALWPSF